MNSAANARPTAWRSEPVRHRERRYAPEAVQAERVAPTANSQARTSHRLGPTPSPSPRCRGRQARRHGQDGREPSDKRRRSPCLRHGALCVWRMVRRGGRTTAAAVSAKVGADDHKFAGKPRRHAAPHQVRLRKTVATTDQAALIAMSRIAARGRACLWCQPPVSPEPTPRWRGRAVSAARRSRAPWRS
jgi:hypothetical protein